MLNFLVQLHWLSTKTYFTFEPGSPGIPRPPSIPERPWVTHSSQIAALCSTALYTSDFNVKACNTQDILFFPAFLWVPVDLATPAIPLEQDKNQSMWGVRHKLRQGMMWFNRCKSGVKTVLTAGPLSPLCPLRPVGPGPPCMIKRIQQTWLKLHRSLNSFKFYTNWPHFYNQFEYIRCAEFTVAESS